MFRLWPPPTNADEAVRRIDLGLICLCLLIGSVVIVGALVSQLPTTAEGLRNGDMVGVPGRPCPPSRPARISQGEPR